MPPEPSVDYDRLEEYLQALAHGRRLELLHILQVPHALQDIRIKPGKHRAGDRPLRPVSRQAVQRHLETLQGIGVIVARASSRGRKEFIVDPQRVYQVLEELRSVGTLTAATFVSRDATVEGAAAPPRALEPGPKLVLVHGFVEGKVFPLRRSELQDGGGWVIGRKPGLHVTLDYDPFVSLVNSEITLEHGAFLLNDLGSSKNGTWINWSLVGSESRPLRSGDVVGVGRSLLVFQAE